MSRPWVYPLLAIALTTSVGRAQPASVSRTLRTIDFEERRPVHVDAVPMHWVKVEGPGLPHYVNARLATDVARSGRFSFRFELNGGSIIYRYDASRIPVQRHARYRVDCWVRTTPLPRARARLTAYLVDAAGNPLPGRVYHSALYASPPGSDEWHRLELLVSVGDEPAEAMAVELGLLQPSLYADEASPGSRPIPAQDIRGVAWFDDLSVAQVPSVQMTPDRPGGVFRRQDPLRLHVLVNDRFLDDLSGRLVVRDAEGREVYQRSGDLEGSSARDLGPGRRRLTLTLPELRPGWYEASLTMSSNGSPVGEQTIGFVRLADRDEPLMPDPRFAWSAVDAPIESWSELPGLLSSLAGGGVSLPIWREDWSVETTTSPLLGRLLERLNDLGIAATGTLAALPPELSRRAGGSDLARLSSLPRDAWQPSLAFVVSRHGRQLSGWQFGHRGLAGSMVDRREMRAVYRAVHAEFSSLLMDPKLVVPWPAWSEIPADAPTDVSLVIPPEVLPENLPLYLAELTGSSPRRRVSVSLVPLDASVYRRETRLRDLVQRVAFSLASDVERIELPLPFRSRGGVVGGELEPTEEALVLRTLVRVLGHARFRGRVPLGEDVEAMLFEQGEEGVLLLWSRGEGEQVRPLEVSVGSSPQRVDLAGNVSPVAVSSAGRARLEVGPVPCFIVGVDVGQALLRASATIDNPLLESSFRPHTRTLSFVNPYRHPISGTLRITGPPGWNVTLQNPSFSLNPGERYAQPLTLEFPFSSTAGPRTLRLEFRLQDSDQGSFVVPLEAKLGLGDVGLQSIALRDGDDVIVQQVITNYGQEPIHYTAFALYPGQARQERLVTGLAPGKTTIKRYRFTGVTPGSGARIRSGLRELDGVRVLNEEIELR